MLRFTLLLISLFFAFQNEAQKPVYITNPSFEDIPRAGRPMQKINITGWYDCGINNFPYETPPDIHPNRKGGFWGNYKEPYEGKTYLGMVTRDNNSWESVSQKVSTPFEADQCYEFSVVLARNNTYLSGSRLRTELYGDDSEVPFTTPIVFRLWGGMDYCDTRQLLVESPPIDHNDWKKYTFNIKPNSNYSYIVIEAFYKVPVLELYNGHILVDGLTEFKPIPCPDEVDVYAVDAKSVDPLIADATPPPAPKTPKKPKKQDKKPPVKETPKEEVAVAVSKKVEKKEEVPVVKKPKKILTELDAKLTKGQVIEIKNLNFAADTSAINKESHEVLDEVYDFLMENKEIIVEIGGHTNGMPADDYCMRLSTARANSVKTYLINKGINPKRIVAKGYGKKEPIASNKTASGRKKNQRVEIKILET